MQESELNLVMGELNMDDMPLPALFEQARKVHFTATESGDGVDQEEVKKACRALEKCDEMISKLGLFSTNETKEDISTTNLKYIMVPYYLGELTEKVAHDDRIQIVKTAQAKLKEFVSFCEAMELVPGEELEVSRQDGPKSNSMADRRAQKLGSNVKEWQNRSCWKLRSGKSGEGVQLEHLPYQRLLRQEMKMCWMMMGRRNGRPGLLLSLWHYAFDLLEMLKKEEEMLLAFKEGDKEFYQEVLDDRAERAEAWHRNAASRVQYTKPAQPITCATFAQDVLEGRASVSQMHEHKHQPLIFGPASLTGGSLTSERERMAAQVFQPSHRMPTMSIEEAGLKEMEIMNKWQERNVKLMEEANSSWYNDSGKLPGPPQEDDEDDDAAQDKARAWDDWKDDNPRGAGNKKLTPCG